MLDNQALTTSESSVNMSTHEHRASGSETNGDQNQNIYGEGMESSGVENTVDQADSGSIVSDWMEHNAQYTNANGTSNNQDLQDIYGGQVNIIFDFLTICFQFLIK